MNNHIIIKLIGLACGLLTLLVLSPQLGATDLLIKEQPHKIYHVLKDKTLLQATNQIANRSGVNFKINTAYKADLINQKIAAEDWKTAISQLLQGYNYTTILDRGNIRTVIITGQNGNGASSNLVDVTPNLSQQIPDQYKALNAGSVMPINLPLAEMKTTPLGKTLTLDLPIGQYQINHDNMIKNADGSTTWIGYLDDEGKAYRFYLSEGEAGLMGNIYTPDGAYNIESDNGNTVLVDLENSGLQNGGYGEDQLELPTNSLSFTTPTINSIDTPHKAGANLLGSTSTTTAPITAAATTATTGPIIDIMVVYTTVKQTQTYAKQRAQYLVNVTNQAYLDSKINMRLRLVHTRRTTYSETNSNNQALNDLTYDLGAFKGIAAVRTQYGADIVALLRPFYKNTAGGCGLSWVGFSNGSAANAKYAFATISDGTSRDSASAYYCHTSTFAHETGHTLGNVHDREYASFMGKFSYSYAWGIQGKFGTIMSYKSPPLLLFSTPLLPIQCMGVPCGYAEGSYRSSDQTRTINYTAPYVTNYRPKTITTPVIQ